MNDSHSDPDELNVLLIFFGYQGGMAQYSAQLANSLSTHAQVTVIAPEGEEVQELFEEQVELYLLPRPDLSEGRVRTVLRSISAVASVNRYIIGNRPDIIHLPFLAGLPSIIMLSHLWIHRIPLVGTIHDPVSHQGQEIEIAGRDLRVVAFRYLTKTLDKIIVHGEGCKDQAIEAGYPPERINVLPHGLYTHFESTDDGNEPILESDNILLFFGKIRPNKGFDRIPEILDGVNKEIEDVTAIVAGSSNVGWQISDDELDSTLSILRNDDRIHLHDRYIPNDEVGQFFRSATITVLPYYDATASGVAMTAYTFEVPMVATRTGDMGKIIEDDESGIVVDPASTQKLSESIVKILKNPDLHQRIVENIKSSREQYSWSHIAERTISLYNETIED